MSDDEVKPGKGENFAVPDPATKATGAAKRPAARPPEEPKRRALSGAAAADDDEDEDGEDDEEEDDEDHDGPVVYTAGEAAGALSGVLSFTWPHLGPHRLGIALVGLGLLVEMAFNVLMPLSLKYLLDEVFEDKDRSELIFILSVLGIAGIVTSVVAIWYEWIDAKVTAAITTDVRRSLFEHIQKLPLSFYERHRRGEILSRFSNDMTTYEESVIHFANWGALPLLELLAGIALLIYLNTELGLLALLIIPIALIGPRLLTPKAVAASYEVKRAQAGELGVVQENIGAQPVVKAFGLIGISQRWFGQRNSVLRAAQSRSTFLNTMVERSITIVVLWLHLIVLAIGAYLTFNDVITVGTFVAFEAVFWEITYNLNHLTQYIPVVIDASGAVRHMRDILDEPIRVSDRPNAVECPRIAHEIGFQGVRFSYGGEGAQIDGLDLAIPAGSRVAIVGPSGAGKSTLLSLLLRFHDPQRGKVTIDGVDIASVTRDSLRAQMAVVFQDNVLFNTSLRENIRLGSLDASDAEVEAAAKKAEIHKFIISLPDGYDTIVGERGETLSGGQRQRIAIARALLRDPAILLLDEATSALDQTTEAAINRTLKKIGRGRSLLFVTHRLTSVADMDEIIVMDAGRVVQRGDHATLMRKRSGLYRKLWNDQMRASAEDDDD
ncbi:ATP-binding cassette, subfamily B [Bosea lupini]|uniref:ATP-binding cassette, subfamily B n=1 Tax=Bosea lupini TaxID=1036779 RepID=A0A1H8ASF8_9HYPH|nr:ABC transporter ATP-binding protein [Bosea lupini]SEM72447.1 ATP-binding cassette, subfamily B [Bosea lupini]